MAVHLKDGTQASAAYRTPVATERYYCTFGLNPAYLDTMVECGLVVSGADQDGEPRVIELPDHDFFMGTLFVPQMSSTPAQPHPLIAALVAATIASVSC